MIKATVRTVVKYFVFLVMDAWMIYRHERKLLQQARYVEFKKITREMKRSQSYSYSGDIWGDEDDTFICGFDSYQDLVDAYRRKLSSSEQEPEIIPFVLRNYDSGMPNEKPFTETS